MSTSTASRPAGSPDAGGGQADKLTALHARLAEQVERLSSGEDWAAWLRVAARFHDYSLSNVLLILAQRPDATRVAGYRTWQTLGRQVDKGQHGIQILAPVTRRTDPPATKDTDPAAPNPEASPESLRRVVGWRVAHVWDISQTSGAPLPEPPTAELLAGAAPDALWDALSAHVSAAGYTLERGDCAGANGVTRFTDRVVRVRADVDDAQAVKTLAHELAHVLLHDPSGAAPRESGNAVRCRGTVEVEAESVAYLVCASAGLPTDDYTFPYIATWAANTANGKTPAEVVTATGQRVLGTARTILHFLEDRGTDSAPATLATVRRRTAAPTARIGTAPDAIPTAAAEPADEDRLRDAHAAAAAWYRDQLLSPLGAGPRRYLDQRALAPVLDPDDPWQVGYAPAGWSSLTTHLRGAGFTDAELQLAGLALRSSRGTLIDRFRDRIMLPIRDTGGQVIAFIGRAPDHRTDRTPKYLNSPTTALYSKGKHLFGLGVRNLHGRRAALVEGPFDVLALHTVVPALPALAPCGTALTPAHARLLQTAGVRDLVLAFDADLAGTNATTAAKDSLRDYIAATLVARLPSGSDPASIAETRPTELVDAVTNPSKLTPLTDVLIDEALAARRASVDTAEGRVTAARDLAALLADLTPPDIGRHVHHVARTLDVPTDTLTAALTDAITNEQRQPGGGIRSSPAITISPTPRSAPPAEPAVRRPTQSTPAITQSRSRATANSRSR
jgi:DNA primase